MEMGARKTDTSKKATPDLEVGPLSAHPFAEIFQEVSGSNYRRLSKSMGRDGLGRAIILYRGQILDGRARYRACLKSEVAPHFEEYMGNDPLDFVLRKNRRRKVGILSKESERTLVQRVQERGCDIATQKLVEAHKPFIKKVAGKYCFVLWGSRHESLIECGVVGLLASLKTFNLSLGYRLNTWSRWSILKEMMEYIVNADVGGIKLSSKEQIVFYNLMRAKSHFDIYEATIPEEKLDEVTTYINKDRSVKVTKDQVRAVNECLCSGDLHLDTLIKYEDGGQGVRELGEDKSPTPEATFEMAEGRDKIWSNIGDLPERQQTIIRGRFRDGDPITYDALGAELGITATRVTQIEKQALTTLKKLLKNSPHPFGLGL